MSILGGLRALVRRSEKVPPVFLGGFAPSGLDAPDDPSMNSPDSAALETGAGLTFGIEYETLDGCHSRRRVTLLGIDAKPPRGPRMRAFCHERVAPRAFKLDRIAMVFDMDGVVYHDIRGYLREELHLDPDRDWPGDYPEATGEKSTAAAVAAQESLSTPGRAQRLAAGDGLRILVSIARADGFLHDKEVEAVLDYAIQRSALEGLETTTDDMAALAAYIRRLRPTSTLIDICLASIEQESPECIGLLLDSSVAVMEADGVLRPEELKLVRDIQRKLCTPASY